MGILSWLRPKRTPTTEMLKRAIPFGGVEIPALGNRVELVQYAGSDRRLDRVGVVESYFDQSVYLPGSEKILMAKIGLPGGNYTTTAAARFYWNDNLVTWEVWY